MKAIRGTFGENECYPSRREIYTIPLLNHLYFRDYLRQPPETAAAYGRLKKTNAYPDDINAYVEKKTTFIIDILRKAGFPETELAAIIAQNKAPK
jgi:GrpB-like predicted nucleotidyltransferase (UPF0157 family)